MAKKDDLIAKAVEADLGVEADLKELTTAQLEELLGDGGNPPAPGEGDKPPSGDGDGGDKPPEEEAPAPAAAAEPEKKKVVTVDDLVKAGRIGVAK